MIEAGGERRVLDLQQPPDDTRGVEAGAGGIGVGVVPRKIERLDPGPADRVVNISHDRVDVDERHARFPGDRGRPRTVVFLAAYHRAILPFAARHRGEHDDGRARGPTLIDHLAQIIPESVDLDLFAGAGADDGLNLVAEPRQIVAIRADGAPGVIVAELQEHHVVLPQLGSCTAAQCPSVMNVRALRPPRAQFLTRRRVGSKNSPSISPQPWVTARDGAAVESPQMNRVGGRSPAAAGTGAAAPRARAARPDRQQGENKKRGGADDRGHVHRD